uniref:Uncharacterized protein n=1 Tax=Arundo donax TaxID=35708 RepID=A0A0A9T2M3_ARUDO
MATYTKGNAMTICLRKIISTLSTSLHLVCNGNNHSTESSWDRSAEGG